MSCGEPLMLYFNFDNARGGICAEFSQIERDFRLAKLANEADDLQRKIKEAERQKLIDDIANAVIEKLNCQSGKSLNGANWL